jgi:hypothetical protein
MWSLIASDLFSVFFAVLSFFSVMHRLGSDPFVVCEETIGSKINKSNQLERFRATIMPETVANLIAIE